MHHQNSTPIGEHSGSEEYIHRLRDLKLPPLLSPMRVSGLLDMDRRRIYELVETGDLAAVRIGRRGLRIFRDSLIDWLSSGGSR